MKKLLFVLLAAISVPAFADNYGFLRDAPFSFFTDEDYKIFKINLDKALNNNRDNTKLSWVNPKSGASGYFIPYHTTKKNGLTCRELKDFTQAEKRTGMGHYVLCRVNGQWLVKS